MLNVIWPIFIIASVIYGVFAGRMDAVTNSIFESAESAVQLTITFFGTLCLWNGIMQIASKTTMIEKIAKLLSPLMRFLFKEIKKEDKAYKEISMNIVANIMGLGNAATPLGLKAMKTLQKDNPNKKVLTNSMAMLIVINTASLQIIPTTVIAIRSSLGSENPTSIIVGVWVATIAAFITVVIATKILSKKFWYEECV